MMPLQLVVTVCEGVALSNIACGEATLEPLHALLARTVIERLRHHISLCFLLQVVITDQVTG